MAGRGEQQRGGVIGEDRERGVGGVERAMDEEAQGHSPLWRQTKKMKERQKPAWKNGVHVSMRAEGWGGGSGTD